MKVTENTLKITRESWSDPGDYPSNAGGGPLPDKDFIAKISGYVTLADFSPADIVDLLEDGDKKILDLINDQMTGVKIWQVEYRLHEGQVQASVVLWEER